MDAAVSDNVTDTPEEQGRKRRREKPERPEKRERSQNSPSGKAVIWVILGTVLLLAVLAVVMWMFNPMGLRDRFTDNVLMRIPIVNNLVKPSIDQMDGYAAMSPDELAAEIERLQSAIDDRDRRIANIQAISDQYVQEIDRLETFERQQAIFKTEKAEFDRMVTEGDPTAYARFYESVYPENAEYLYPQAAANARYASDLKKYVRDFQSMDAKKVALILEEMVLADMNLVILILDNLDSDQAGEILGEMTPQNASAISRNRAPQEY